MRNRIVILIFLLSVFFTLLGCAHFDRILTIPDIEGTWEGIHFGYYYLDIRDDGKGYLVISIDGEAETAYKITDITFLKGQFVLSLKEHGKTGESLKLEGALFGKNILVLSELEKDSKKSKELLFFMRESITPELREKSKEKIKEIQGQNI